MAFENIRMEIQGHTAILTLDRPPANPVNLATVEEIDRALDTLETDAAVRVVIITGGGEKGFCAGFDVSDFAKMLTRPGSGARPYGPASTGFPSR